MISFSTTTLKTIGIVAASAIALGTMPACAAELTLQLPRSSDTAPYIYAPARLLNIVAKVSGAEDGDMLPWKATDYSGKTIAKGKERIVSGQAELRIRPTEPGIIYVHAGIDGKDGKPVTEAKAQFAVWSPDKHPAQDDTLRPMLYGISAHINGLGPFDAEREIAFANAVGFKACRFDMAWGQIQPERGVWNWPVFDTLYSLMGRYDIQPAPVLAYTARWASTGDKDSKDWSQWNNSPPITADYAAFARAAAERYGRQTPTWEIWNEPDLDSWRGTPAQYAEMFDAARSSIRRVSPKARVLNGGISEVGMRPNFIADWQRAAKSKPDIFAFHSHMGFANMLRAHGAVEGPLKNGAWTMPVWLNESGFSTVGDLTEADQAINLVKKMAYAPAMGVSAFFLYDLCDDGADPKDSEQNYGMSKPDLQPKAGTVAVHTLISTLRNQTFIRRIPVPNMPNAYALLYGSDRVKGGTLVIWNEDNSQVPLGIRVPGAARQVSIMGVSFPLNTRGGAAAIDMTPEPAFIPFSGDPASFKITGPLLALPAIVTAAPHGDTSFILSVRNPASTPSSYRLTINAGKGWKVEPSTVSSKFPAGGTATLTVHATNSEAADGALNVSLSVDGIAKTSQAHSALRVATVIPRRESSLADDVSSGRTVPVTKLDSSHLISLYFATQMDRLKFHGDKDLSANVYMARTPAGLEIVWHVEDDIFNQKEAPGFEWRGDSIQWAISLPTGENYEWTTALTAFGPVAGLDFGPPGVKTGHMDMPVTITRKGTETIYDVVVPETLPGGAKLTDQFSFTCLLNDDDGEGRKGWIEWTPGIGQAKDPLQFEPIIVK